jgi:hypothetical protein
MLLRRREKKFMDKEGNWLKILPNKKLMTAECG